MDRLSNSWPPDIPFSASTRKTWCGCRFPSRLASASDARGPTRQGAGPGNRGHGSNRVTPIRIPWTP
eukprot:3594394-Prymnesium_polylepis.2